MVLLLVAGGGLVAAEPEDTGSAGSAGDGPSIEIQVSDGEVHLGDQVRVKVLARSGEGWLWGGLSVASGGDEPWAVVTPPSELAGAQPPVWELTLMPLQLGELDLPEVGVSARAADGTTRDLVPRETPKITVVSALGDEAEKAEPAA